MARRFLFLLNLAVWTAVLFIAFPERADAHDARELRTELIPTGSRQLARLDGATLVKENRMPSAWCGARTRSDRRNPLQAPMVKMVYARTADAPDRFSEMANAMQTDAGLMSELVAGESGQRKSIRFDLGSSCGNRYLDITDVVLPRPARSYRKPDDVDFALLDSDLKHTIPTENVNLLVYLDGMRPDGTWGLGMHDGDDWSGPENTNHLTGRTALVIHSQKDLLTQPTMALHELAHTLGAVQNSAPHSTNAGHCFEDWDIMCYDDDGSKMPAKGLLQRCNPLEMLVAPQTRIFSGRLDCGQDDYFNPTPAPGSYLSTHWNVYDSPFLASCFELRLACAPAAEPLVQPLSSRARTAMVSSRAKVTMSKASGSFGPTMLAGARVRLPRGTWTLTLCTDLSWGKVFQQDSCRIQRLYLRRASMVSFPLTLELPSAGARLVRARFRVAGPNGQTVDATSRTLRL